MLARVDEPILVGDPNAVQHRTTFTYEGGDLVAVTDPSGRTTRRSVDAVGRTRTVTDPLGHVTRYGYDLLDQVRTITDPRDGITTLTYDRNGNLKTVEDARQHETLHTLVIYSRLWMVSGYHLYLSLLAIVSALLALWTLIANRSTWRAIMLVTLGLVIGQWWLIQFVIAQLLWGVRGFAP